MSEEDFMDKTDIQIDTELLMSKDIPAGAIVIQVNTVSDSDTDISIKTFLSEELSNALESVAEIVLPTAQSTIQEYIESQKEGNNA